jgi:hypothetical protein
LNIVGNKARVSEALADGLAASQSAVALYALVAVIGRQ